MLTISILECGGRGEPHDTLKRISQNVRVCRNAILRLMLATSLIVCFGVPITSEHAGLEFPLPCALRRAHDTFPLPRHTIMPFGLDSLTSDGEKMIETLMTNLPDKTEHLDAPDVPIPQMEDGLSESIADKLVRAIVRLVIKRLARSNNRERSEREKPSALLRIRGGLTGCWKRAGRFWRNRAKAKKKPSLRARDIWGLHCAGAGASSPCRCMSAMGRRKLGVWALALPALSASAITARMKKLDSRSLVLGLTAGILGTLSLGAVSSNTTGSVGRFRLETMESHAFVIDTVSGQVWRGYFPSGMGGKTNSDFEKPKISQ